MAYLNILFHPNLVKYFGFYFDHLKRICVVMERATKTLLDVLRTPQERRKQNNHYNNNNNNNLKNNLNNNLNNIQKQNSSEKFTFIEGNFTFHFEESKKIAMQITSALKFVHNLKIAHRDLKPSNILWFRYGNHQPIVKIADFGISRNINEEINNAIYQNTITKGTISYIAPDLYHLPQIPLNQTLLSGDVYSLGYLLHEIYYGEVHELTHDQFKLNQFLNRNYYQYQNEIFPFGISDQCEWKSLINQCWSSDSSNRPPIKFLHKQLKLISKNHSKNEEEIFIFIDLSNVFIKNNKKEENLLQELSVEKLVLEIEKGRKRVAAFVAGTNFPVDFSNIFSEFSSLGFTSIIETISQNSIGLFILYN